MVATLGSGQTETDSTLDTVAKFYFSYGIEMDEVEKNVLSWSERQEQFDIDFVEKMTEFSIRNKWALRTKLQGMEIIEAGTLDNAVPRTHFQGMLIVDVDN